MPPWGVAFCTCFFVIASEARQSSVWMTPASGSPRRKLLAMTPWGSASCELFSVIASEARQSSVWMIPASGSPRRRLLAMTDKWIAASQAPGDDAIGQCVLRTDLRHCERSAAIHCVDDPRFWIAASQAPRDDGCMDRRVAGSSR